MLSRIIILITLSLLVGEYSSAQPIVSGNQGTVQFPTYPFKDPDEPNICGIVGGASMWLAFAPTNSGVFYLNTIGSSFDTLLGVFIDDGLGNDYASLIQQDCDDNSGDGVKTSALEMPVTKGVTYYIMIDGKNGATGNVVLNYLLDRKPTISSIATQSIDEEQSTAPISFTIKDPETAADCLQVFGTSTNQSLVTNSAIVFGGTGTNRTVTITPTPYFYGTNTITISVMDAAGNVSSTNFLLQVRKINHAPVAIADSYTRLTNTVISIAINALLRNDTDVDGNALTLTAVSKSQLGLTVTKGPSTVVYNSRAGLNSTDYFTYTISDGNGGTATGIVTIYVGANGVIVVN